MKNKKFNELLDQKIIEEIEWVVAELEKRLRNINLDFSSRQAIERGLVVIKDKSARTQQRLNVLNHLHKHLV